MKVKFADFLRQYNLIKEEIDTAMHRVLDSGWYILGKEGAEFEKEFATYNCVEYAVGCASGTEAIALALMALGVGYDDEVLTVANTAVPTATGIMMTGARPTFVDIDPKTLMMDINSVEVKLTDKVKAIMPVHLFGSAVEMDPLMKIAGRYGIPVVEDCAQSCGTNYHGSKTGSIGMAGAFSFYPSKNLGCYGDGGAVTTNDRGLYEKLLMLRNYGQEKRYFHSTNGINSRLDEMQAAVLRVKLEKLDKWNERRRQIAGLYLDRLKGLPLEIPEVHENVTHVYHLFVILVDDREGLTKVLEDEGIQTLIHYPVPVHLQKAFQGLGFTRGSFPVGEETASRILSLPMWPELTDEEVFYICDKIEQFLR